MRLTAENLAAGYGDRPVLEDVSFSLEPGEFVAILGPNGSGKTTLVRTLSRTLKPQMGAVRADGRDLYALSAKESARLVAVVPQHEDPVFDFTVREIVGMARYPWTNGPETPRDREAVDRALETARCTELADRPLSRISGGERQRALVARALAQETPVLLLDEPTAHMDVGYQIATLSIMRKLSREGKAVAAALHDLNLAAGFADRAILLHNGRIVIEGAVEEVLESAEIERVYGAAFARMRDERTGRLVLVPEFVPERARAARSRRVHLIGGGGSAAALLTELWQLGHRLSLGITHVSDSDYAAAVRLEVPCATAPPLSHFDSSHRSAAMDLARDAAVVLVCAAPCGSRKRENRRVAEGLAEMGKEVWLIERGDEEWDFTGGEAATRTDRARKQRIASMRIEEVATTL